MEKTYKSMYKWELAEAAGVSNATFRSWIASHKNELKAMGNSPYAKILNPAAVRYLCDFFLIDISDYEK